MVSLERFRNYDQFKDYFDDLQDVIESVIKKIAGQNWGKLGRYV